MRRLESLPSPTQRLLLAAAAEPLGDVPLLHGAAERLGIGPDAALPAEAAGLVEINLRVRFRHPLVRAAAYRAATAPDRREVHRALAEATDPGADPDRHAWHRAHAAVGPDEAVAAELERSAARAAGRGGVAAEAAFLERATQLTPDPRRRGPRALAAARAQLDAGSWDEASELLAVAEASPLDELQEAQLVRLHARIAFARSRGATPRRCCSRRHDGSSRSMPAWHTRPISTPSGRRSSPVASPRGSASTMSPRQPAGRHRARSRHGRWTCSSKA